MGSRPSWSLISLKTDHHQLGGGAPVSWEQVQTMSEDGKRETSLLRFFQGHFFQGSLQGHSGWDIVLPTKSVRVYWMSTLYLELYFICTFLHPLRTASSVPEMSIA